MSAKVENFTNVVNVTYAQAGTSVNTDEMGMREMQRRVYAQRTSQYLLVKAPPASGKSRALMFVALDKLYNQGIKKVIVAVPERSIGASFSNTELSKFGFFADWKVPDHNNLCTPGSNESKVTLFKTFLDSTDPILICTHQTLRFAAEQLSTDSFNDILLAIDEFHHASADVENSRLGALVKDIMAKSTAHLVAMTGSYFRGDSVPVLDPADEAKFTPVTFNYYDQLNGYEHLKTLGIGHHFYQGRYTDAIHEVLDLSKKTILHIPHVNSGESTKDKYEEVGLILDTIGTWQATDPETGIHTIHTKDGRPLKVADLVNDTNTEQRATTLHYLSTIARENRDAVDIIIALGMAKEGFDWPFAEHALTVGYRASMTEIIQIIGRVTRDTEGKTHAQFTNLLAEPDATQSEVTVSVNNVLKAITASLLMEQVLAPNFDFKTRRSADEENEPGVLRVKGLKEPSTQRVKQIIATDLNDIKANVLQDDTFVKAAAAEVDPIKINRILMPRIIRERYPDLTDTEVEELRQRIVTDSVVKNGEVRTVGTDSFIKMGTKFVNIQELNINLIDSVNPFQRAFEVISKKVDVNVMRLISDEIASTKIEMTKEEARNYYDDIKNWRKLYQRDPRRDSDDPQEKLLAHALLVLRHVVAERKRQKGSEE